MNVHFVLVCEGPSDRNLIAHLRSLIVDCGADEAFGVSPDYARLPSKVSRNIESKVRAAMRMEKDFDLLFIHRDADSPDPEPRYEEIRKGIEKSEYSSTWVGVVPVQEMEAWLLLDETAIRRVSGRLRGKTRLKIPTPKQVEKISRPKERLKDLILTASEARGRRKSLLKRDFPKLRARLLRELQPVGPLCLVTSWIRLKEDTHKAIEECKLR